MEKIMAVVTAEKKYAERFCTYVNRKNELLFTAVPFDSMENYSRFGEGHKIELLLADREMVEAYHHTDSSRKYSARVPARTMLFDERGSGGIPGEEELYEVSINKYQSAEAIMREVMGHCTDMELRRSREPVGREVTIYGVYSPVGRCGKTTFALLLSKELSMKQKTLYLNFEEFSGFEAMTGEEYRESIADALYHMKQKTLNAQKLQSLIYHYGGIDYIPPVLLPEDIGAVSGAEYAELLSEILKISDYTAVVADLPGSAAAASEVMDLCEAVYMPVLSDPVSERKVGSFEAYLAKQGKAGLLERMIRFTLPKTALQRGDPGWLENMLFSEAGDLVRQLTGYVS